MREDDDAEVEGLDFHHRFDHLRKLSKQSLNSDLKSKREELFIKASKLEEESSSRQFEGGEKEVIIEEEIEEESKS